MEQFNNTQTFEVHVTINPTEDVDPFINICESFTQYASERAFPGTEVCSCKPVIIELPEGTYQQQPMSSIFVISTLDQAVKYGEMFGEYCKTQNSNYQITRNKVEARFRNVLEGTINLDNFDKAQGLYWEFHIKLLFDKIEGKPDEFRHSLQAEFPFARLSRSALSKPNQTQISRIVTLRLYKGDKDYAHNELDKLEEYLNEIIIQKRYKYEVRKNIEKELSVYDTNVLHDRGWINMKNDSVSGNTTNKSEILRFLLFAVIVSKCVFLINSEKVNLMR
jgi:hypothetical protein